MSHKYVESCQMNYGILKNDYNYFEIKFCKIIDLIIQKSTKSYKNNGTNSLRPQCPRPQCPRPQCPSERRLKNEIKFKFCKRLYRFR